MALRTGLSHAASGLLSSLVVAVVVEVGRLRWTEYWSSLCRFGESISRALRIPLDGEAVAVLLTATLLSFIWGVIYHRRRWAR